VAVAGVDVAVDGDALLVRGIELGDLRRDRRDEAEAEGGEAQRAEEEEEREESELPDPAPTRLRRLRGASTPSQNRAIVTLDSAHPWAWPS
jgi:hypothetical protein